jgi:cysteinyl-tRNA synthetase
MSKYLYIIILISLFSCKKTDREYTYDDIDFKEEMRSFVIDISRYAKSIRPGFNIIPQNGVKLITQNGSVNGNVHQNYVQAIDGQGQEGLFYGYLQDDIPTDNQTTDYLKLFLNKLLNNNKKIFVTDYCYSPPHINDAYQKNDSYGYTGFVATSRELDIIPTIPVHHSNSNDINDLNDAENFLYILNTHLFINKQMFIQSIRQTNYDVIIMDLFFDGDITFTPQEIAQLKHKANGGQRILIAYISIGEAEDYRYYWKPEWNDDKPIWLDRENPEWPGNYKVRYWEKDWQKIIYGNNQSYIKKIIDAGFDGAYLDIIDAFEFFEERY